MNFEENHAAIFGGGIYTEHYSIPDLSHVNFYSNNASSGGGMHNYNASPILNQVVFENDSASSGGGMGNNNGSPQLSEVIFKNNYASSGGGGLTNNASGPVLINVSFLNNSTPGSGGGIYETNSSHSDLSNVVFYNNTATDGGGMYIKTNSYPVIRNATFYSNSASNEGGGIYNLFCNVLFGNSSDISNASNISSSSTNNASDGNGGGISTTSAFISLSSYSPSQLFFNISNIEGADGIIGTGDDGLIPIDGCVLVNAGDSTKNSTTTDLAGHIRNYSINIDIGAYENQPLVSICSYSNNSRLYAFASNNNSITIVNSSSFEGTVNVYNTLGQLMFCTILKAQMNEELPKVFKTGIYLVYLSNNE